MANMVPRFSTCTFTPISNMSAAGAMMTSACSASASMARTASDDPDSRQAWVRLAIALLIGSIGAVGMWAVVVVLPVVQVEFGATRGAVSLATTAIFMGFGSGGVLTGRITDRFGIVAAMALLVLVLRAQIGGAAVRDHANAPPPQVNFNLSTNALTVLLCIASISCCVAMAMPQVHIVAYCGDLGYGVARGAEMLSLMMGFGIISRIGSGFLADRIGGVRTLLIGSVAQGFALLFYLFFDSLTSLYLISGMFGLFQGGIVPSYAIIVREAMPAAQAATRVGIVIFASVFGMSFGGWASGVIFDATGSYAAAFANGLAWNVLNIAIIVGLLMRARQRLVPA